MGNKLQKVIRSFGDRNARIIMLGLDAAGKTTILYKLKLKEHINPIPTIGINVETVNVTKNVSFTVWDVGGQEKVRPFWRHFYQNTEGLLFVIDSADNDRIQEARDELFNILADELMSPGVPVVVLGNKQDLPNASKAYELIAKLEMSELKDNPWHVQEICALTGDGLYQGIQRLAIMVKEFHKRKGK